MGKKTREKVEHTTKLANLFANHDVFVCVRTESRKIGVMPSA